MTFRSTTCATFLLISICFYIADSHSLSSGDQIAVGTEEGRGPLATHGIVSYPLGAARLLGAAQPDLLVRTTKFGHDTGLFAYPWLGTTPEGVPVFGNRVRVGYPFEGHFPPAGSLYTTSDGVVHAVWIQGNELVDTVFDKENLTFEERNRVKIEGLPRNPGALEILPNPDGTVEVVLEVSDGTRGRPEGVGGRHPDYNPYDGAGIWRGGLPAVGFYGITLSSFLQDPLSPARLVSNSTREILSSAFQIASVDWGEGHGRGILAGSRFGNLSYYRNKSESGIALAKKRFVVGENDLTLRHPTINACPVAFPNPETGLSDLIAGGEGGLHYYRFTGSFTEMGNPVFEEPVPALEEHAELYGGSLPVPNVVDWDGDGVKDMVSGNSEGFVLFFKNVGSNEAPAFLPGEAIHAGGRKIHIQPGYRLDIQGPFEARWGYVCPNVADWNGDGLLDLLLSDSTARHTVYMNRGTRTQPALDAGSPLYLDGLDLHGTWRVKPGVAKLGNRMAYVALDDQDEFHLYWRIDDRNLEDGGKLRLDDGSVIRANFLSAGGTGRLKINLVDWNGDGKTDLLVGTPRHGSVPNPETGLPQSLGLPGSAVLFLENTGTEDKPRFAFPEIIEFRGEPIFLGQHACGPTPADFGNESGPDLIVGEESGRFLFYAREDLSHTGLQR